jgi:riboflavin biosynthesis pyrimidine reductase
VAINFAVTADGSSTLSDGKSGGIGDEGDLAMFRALRDRVDAVMAGTTTMAVEGYRRLIRDDERRAERVVRGLIADPLAVTISRSGVLPLAAPIFGDPHQRTIAFVPTGKGSDDPPPGLEEVELAGVTPQAALEHLARLGVRSVLCEGGPNLVSALAAGDLIDDVFLTIAPKFAGGNESGVTTGPPLASPIEFELAHIAEREGSLFIRWSRRPAEPA